MGAWTRHKVEAINAADHNEEPAAEWLKDLFQSACSTSCEGKNFHDPMEACAHTRRVLHSATRSCFQSIPSWPLTS